MKDTASCATAGSLNMDGGWVRRPSDDPENKTKQTNKKDTFKVLYKIPTKTAARLALLGERRSAEREAVGSNPGRTNTQGL